ncbi:MAG: DUF4417 domain-containing protein [Tyzzerella sp.]|nr:DUF4417 domain-containing protein [Tyzzerella sp.]
MFQRDIENWYKFNFEDVGKYGVPALLAEIIETEQFIPFNYAKSCKNADKKGIHFFLHDYQFRRLWDMPERYMLMLQRFNCVCTPDYSLYTDMPKAMQIYHHYKKQWMGAYWQANGITVIPTVSWSDEESLSWCFDGIPKGAAVAVSSVGCLKDKASREGFMLGYQAMLNTLHPRQILFYGTVPEEVEEKVICIGSFQERFGKIKEK